MGTLIYELEKFAAGQASSTKYELGRMGITANSIAAKNRMRNIAKEYKDIPELDRVMKMPPGTVVFLPDGQRVRVGEVQKQVKRAMTKTQMADAMFLALMVSDRLTSLKESLRSKRNAIQTSR